MNQPIVSINLVVYNEENRIKDCLKAVFNQTYPPQQMKVLVFDNNSGDNTIDVVKKEFPAALASRQIKIHKADKNYLFGPGQNRAAKMTSGKYILGLCADVWLKEDFIEQSVKIMEANTKIGALQAKIYRLIDGEKSNIIDTAGFEIYKSRRVVNRGHGMQENKDSLESPFSNVLQDLENSSRSASEKFNAVPVSASWRKRPLFSFSKLLNFLRTFAMFSKGDSSNKSADSIRRFNKAEEIFSYEGACPFWRRSALEDTAVNDQFHEEDFSWYADDLDLGWRMHLMGWKNYFAPQVIAWHERHTTKRLSTGRLDFIKQRRTLPKDKKMLDWANTRLTIIKNDVGLLTWPDIYLFAKREVMFFLYALIFEPYTIFIGVPRIIKYLPVALKKRRDIMKRKKVTAEEIKKWYK